jgi:carbon monoxide dehydrogenase subunit G
MITIDERIDVPASPETVWSILSDPHQVVNCLPDATLGEEHEDGSFDGSITVQVGPLKIRFKVRLRMVLDETVRMGRVSASGKEAQFGTQVEATWQFAVAEDDPSASLVTLTGRIEIKGPFAGLIDGGAKAIAQHVTQQFGERLTRMAREAEATATA